MKGPEAGEEAASAAKAIHELNGTLEGKKDFVLSDGSKRTILVIEKKEATPQKYPRTAAKIQKAPL